MSEQSPLEDPTIEGEQQRPQRRLDPTAKRNLWIIGGVMIGAIVVVLLLVLRTGNAKAQQQGAGESQINLGTQGTQRVDSVSPEMAAKVEAKQRTEADAAKRRGESYIPPDNLGQVQPVNPAAGPANGPGPNSYGITSAPVTQYAQFNSETEQRRREGLQRQLAALLGDGVDTSASAQGQRQRVGANEQSGAQQGQRQQVAAAAPTAAVSAPRREVLGGLTVHPAKLSSDIRVAGSGGQSSGFATAEITAGPAAGALLIGTAKPVADEFLEITFSQMRLNGKVYTIDARALNETTSGVAIDGSVDHRIMQRYVFPVALAAAQGFYTAKSQTGSTLTAIGSGGGSTSAVTTPAPSTEQARAAGIAAGLQIASQDVQRAAQAPVVITRERSYPIGVLFNTAVLESQ
jgi:intracellular multiplication protein IcmE